MSLDVHLETSDQKTVECPHCHGEVSVPVRSEEVYWANITHNLGRMAEAAGIYKHLWRPEEIGITKAAQLTEPLEEWLRMLQSEPDRFRQYDSPNGWGVYDNLVFWVGRYLQACRDNPDANVRVSR